MGRGVAPAGCGAGAGHGVANRGRGGDGSGHGNAGRGNESPLEPVREKYHLKDEHCALFLEWLEIPKNS